jgi:hypothetical protein
MLAMVHCRLMQINKNLMPGIDKKSLFMGGFFAFIRSILLLVYFLSIWQYNCNFIFITAFNT